MTFEEVLPILRKGKKIKRKWWRKREYIREGNVFGCKRIVNEDNNVYILNTNDLFADDWEVIKEPKKVKLRDLTEKQYQKWFNNNCCIKNTDKGMSDCFDCVFHNVICNLEVSRCWIKHKDLYSDKFLGQEIEIEY